MDWAARRRFIIIGSVIAVVITLIALTTIAIMYEAPSCEDGIQNQEEEGTDCGGPCSYLCTEAVTAPVVKFTRTFSPREGRHDVIAYVENPNRSEAARAVHYTLEVYSPESDLLATKTGSIDLAPGAVTPVYVPEAYRGEGAVGQAFLTLDQESLRWYEPKDKHVAPRVTNIETTTGEAPRIRATIENPTAFPIYDITPIATVFDAKGNAIAASQTYLSQLGGQAEAKVLFTWTAPFSALPARVEVLPVVPVRYP